MSYTILLLVLAIIQHTRGNNVWTQCVYEVDFLAPRAVQPGIVLQPQMSSPQPMVQQPLPQQVPVQYSAGTPPARYTTPTPSFAISTSPAQQRTQTPANTGYAQTLATMGSTQIPQQQIHSPQPMALPRQVQLQYSATWVDPVLHPEGSESVTSNCTPLAYVGYAYILRLRHVTSQSDIGFPPWFRRSSRNWPGSWRATTLGSNSH